MKWGAFTYSQESEVERLLTALCESVCDIVRRTVPEPQYRALLLIGGYGRGEGGVQPTPVGPRPHNNLDFLLITNLSREATKQVASQVNRELDEVRKAFAIGVDLSAINAEKLRKSPCLVMWYDMRYGHKTLLGDADFATGLRQFEVERIPPWNVLDLLVNRGTLLLLNRWMRQKFESALAEADQIVRDEVRRKLDLIAVRHLVKAIIGYGDTLLYFDGQYHWSYAEKLRRIKNCSLADPEFIEHYTEAAAFRFIADYDALIGWSSAAGGSREPQRVGWSSAAGRPGRDVVQWQQQVTTLLDRVHLCCESLRLGAHFQAWDEYPEAASRAVLAEQWDSPRAWARKLAFLAQDWTTPYPGSARARWGLRAAGARSRLSLAFPVVAYNLSNLEDWACHLIGSEDAATGLLNAYVDRWGQIGDTNFKNFAGHIADLLTPPTHQAATPDHSQATLTKEVVG